MDATGLSFQGIRGNQVSTGPKLLSCASCRQRKIRCNKMHPCEPCQRSSLECVFPSRRVRAPRSKPRGLDTRDAELLRRIKRLERFMSNVDGGTTTSGTSEEPPTPDLSNPTTSAPTPFQPTDIFEQGTQSDVGLDTQYASFIKEQGSGTRRLRGYFWRSLGDEFDGLRQLLEHPVESDEDGDETVSASPESKIQSPLFILKEPDSIADLEASYPSDHHRSILYHFYLANVDPLCKILHRPTINAYLASSQELLDQSNRRYKFTSLEAISFAVYFAAVTSMTPQDCLTHLSKDKDVLLAQYRRSTETALAQADLLNTMEMVTLQAFTIYIMAIRSNDKSRSSWTLTGLAVRIAHALGLHRDGDGTSFIAFEAEMRRRLWWQIVLLDMRAAEDRGSEPVIQDGSFHTRMPCNLNDEDFGQDSQLPLPVKAGVTQMTFCLIAMDVSNTVRKVNFIPHTTEPQTLTLQQKLELVKDCTTRIESHYLAGCDSSDQSTWLVRTMGRLLILKLWLIIQYPLQSRKVTPQEYAEGQVLRTVVAFLTTVEAVEEHESTAGFSWYFKTYVPWHALAVALAKLCNETQGSLADQAWSIIDRYYKKWSERVADSKEGMFWRPIISLTQRARAARQRDLALHEAGGSSQRSLLDPTFSTYDHTAGLPHANIENGVNKAYIPATFQDLGALSQTTNPTLDPNLFNMTDMNLMTTNPSNTIPNWDDWNEFIFDVGAVGTDIPQNFYGQWPMQI